MRLSNPVSAESKHHRC